MDKEKLFSILMARVTIVYQNIKQPVIEKQKNKRQIR